MTVVCSPCYLVYDYYVLAIIAGDQLRFGQLEPQVVCVDDGVLIK
jgi:hypothetical protein